MALQNFVARNLPAINAAWLNAVDVLKFTVFADAVTKAAARTALQLDPQLVAEGVDSGAANTAIVTLNGPITGYVRAIGSKVSFLATAINTGAATLNVNGTGAAAILAQDGTACTGGELFLPVTVMWTGAAWKIVGGGIPLANRRTAAENSAGVTPVNYGKFPSPWKDVSRFVSDNTGVTDVSSQFANALAAENRVTVPPGTYNLGTTGVTLQQAQYLEGAGRNKTIFTYSGTGPAIDGYGKSRLSVCDFSINTQSSTSASAMRFGNGAQHIRISNVECLGDTTASNTGYGILLDAASPGAFSGNLVAELFYSIGYKFGIRATGADTATNTWTTMSFLNCYVLGVGPISGGRGLWFDATTNGVGSTWKGGTIEGYDIGLLCEDGSFGLDFFGDIEGNTTAYQIGNTFGGIISLSGPNATYQRASANGSTNRWMAERHLSGTIIREAYLGMKNVLYNNGGNSAFFDISRGDSEINGGSPTLKFRFATGNSNADNAAQRNYMLLPTGVSISSDAGSPEGVVTAIIGSIYTRTDGGASTTLYVKTSGSGNTGWTAK